MKRRQRTAVSVWFAATLLYVCPAWGQTIIRVSTAGNDANDGSSWGAAKRTVQAAIDAASALGGEVWVKAGTYPERITLHAFAHVYGGFAGMETGKDQRDFRANVTTLDGQRDGPVVTVQSVDSGLSTIDGFTIRNGLGGSGHGIYCSSSSPTIANNTITGNNAVSGGGIYCSSSAPTIANNTITGNSATSGGGIYCDRYSSPTISNNTITGNTASDGGGIYSESSATIANNSITGNIATNGGGIYSPSSATIANNTITGNIATSNGGGIHCYSSATIKNTIIAFNSSGIYASATNGSPTLTFNCVYGNTAYNYSGLTDPTGMNGNISVNPKLAAGQYTGQWHIEPGSPCRNAGDDSVVQPGWLDMDGQARIQGGRVDIGADESDGTEPSASPNVIVRVSAGGNDANDGGSRALSKRTVQAGIDAASAAGGEVWVKVGMYPERVTLRAFAHVYGGFGGTEAARDGRDFRANATILDAQHGGSVVTVQSCGYGLCTIDGFTITNGSTLNAGAGIYCNYSSPTIANNTITGNTAYSSSGGGICCNYSSPAIANNTISGNTASSFGGGISCSSPSSSSLTISNNTIADNTASGGGGIFSLSSATIANNAITGNTACNGAGGGIHSQGSATIAGNTITGNTARGSSGTNPCGGGIYCQAGTRITNNTITGNAATQDGGGVFCGLSGATIANNIVAFNSSGIGVTRFHETLKYNCVYGNTTYNYSGMADPTDSDGNISADPVLAARQYGNLHIQRGSPCVDAGDNASVPLDDRDLDADGDTTEPLPFDLDGQPRIQGLRVDIGADESDDTQWPAGPNVIVRVSPDGNDTNDGSTWATTKRTVQAGMNAASAAGGEVWVKAGTYMERIGLRPYAHVYGGFSGSETAKNQRDFRTNTTVLDGQRGGSVVTIQWAGYGLGTIDGFTIRNGNASSGGVYCSCSSPTIANNTITGNSSSGIYCSASPPTIANNTITGNSGRGIYCSASAPTIANNTITGNSGGGIFCNHSSPTIVNNNLAGNALDGIHCESYSSPTIANNTITGNSGDGIYCRYSSPTIANNTITGNTALHTGGGISCSYSSPTIANTIIAFNFLGIYMDGPSDPILRYNCVYGNTALNYSSLADPTGTNGNLRVDPLFVDWLGGDYRLSAGSPCIDAGDNTAVPADSFDLDGDGDTTEPLPFDLAGGRRFVNDWAVPDTGVGPGSIVDMGAYEFVPADLDGDGDVDLEDFARFRSCFNGSNRPYAASGCADADYDGDTDVDLLDFSRFRSCFNGSNRPARCP